jgi:Leucine-rich repeat (LRR) protein
MIATREAAARAKQPDRLNLDRMGLTACPILQGEQQLRLLNYEGNSISRITHLFNLPNLIFLDLQNNNITEISGINELVNLRVLLLGKNRIAKMENLDALVNLDVLDLHGNRITEIDQVEHMHLLRVLNLSANEISVLKNIESLTTLVELNLDDNNITTVARCTKSSDAVPGATHCLDTLHSLQRLFLTNNEFTTYDSISAMLRRHSLSELALGGNPVSEIVDYRIKILSSLGGLCKLDSDPVSAEERYAVSLTASAHAHALQTGKPSDSPLSSSSSSAAATAAIAMASDEKTSQSTNDPNNVSIAGTASHILQRSVSSTAKQTGSHAANKTGFGATNGRASVHSAFRTHGSDGKDDPYLVECAWRAAIKAASSQIPGDSYLYEPIIDDDIPSCSQYVKSGATLTIFGAAFDQLTSCTSLNRDRDRDRDREKVHLAERVVFNFVTSSRIASQIPALGKLNRLKEIVLNDNAIQSVSELDAFCILSFTSLHITNNQINAFELLRPYCIVRFPALTSFNDVAITGEETLEAKRLLQLGRHWNNPHLQLYTPPAAAASMPSRSSSTKSDSSKVSSRHTTVRNPHAKYARRIASTCVDEALAIRRDTALFDQVWPEAFADFILLSLESIAQHGQRNSTV